MTDGGAGDRLTKNQRREAAREKARQLREEQKKKDRRKKVLLQGGIILGTLAIVAIVALVIVNSIRPAGPGPQNMLADGIKIEQGLTAVQTPGIKAGEDPTPFPENEDDEIDVRVYLDYMCPFCAQFEQANSEQLQTLLDEDAITLEIHPISILDRASQGTRYSTRAVAAMGCVAENSPDAFFGVNTAMFENQPAEGTPGLTNEEIAELISGVEGVENVDDIEECIQDGDFMNWAQDASTRAQNGPIDGTDEVERLESTPLVLVNGAVYRGAPSDAQAFASFIAEAAGDTFTEESTPTPTPTPTS
ncbi:protein-disulfide isomerase [Diaminobutyricimonas aerilata]|uniref:Protein-disulfide isomerase n=1 Tax=Diaminobutyricimonas aerilata TaxID=1162967 RepID=A0A2M9CME4_9MICO|nr:thioredoxin domain-containing protein [Diaminobutyricimonas aerilata]PJJ73044.1 protein-disulfide isomerase [Diaminobutyricimonas aerilata]